ncbi:hypothetical protein BDF19DRAFT_451134 [Syncephalis fuscata]|nr:hypothetical protein BDF19DRAFT_451134 [Syncephalis fuscata]
MKSSTTDQISVSKLLVLVGHLPLNDFIRFISYLDDTVIKFNYTCRSVNTKLKNNKALWQHLYHRRFLSNPHKTKEWDFVYWCIRNQYSIGNILMEAAVLLGKLDWRHVYRRRVTTENNWRYGRSKYTIIPCFEAPRAATQNIRQLTGTALSLPINCMSEDFEDELNQKAVIVELNAFSSNKSQAKAQADSESESTLKTATMHLYSCYDDYQAMLSDQFSAMIIKARGCKNVTIYTRGSCKPQYTTQVPFDAKFIGINGHWMVYLYTSKEDSQLAKLVAWDLRKNRQYTQDLDSIKYTACIYGIGFEHITVYAAKTIDSAHGCIEWRLYQFIEDGSIRKSQQKQHRLNTRVDSIAVSSNEFSRIVMFIRSGSTPLFLCHTVTFDCHMDIVLDGVQKISQKVISIRNDHDDTWMIYHQLLEEQDKELVFNNRFDWSDVIGYFHIIGDLFAIFKQQDTDMQYLLVDMSNGKAIRELDESDKCCVPYFLMTGIVINCSTRSKAISFGAL